MTAILALGSPAARVRQCLMPEMLSPADFQPLLHEIFEVPIDERTCPLTLTSVKAAPRYPMHTRDPFTLLFWGPGDMPLAQGSYPMRHAALPNLEVFIVPVGRANGGFVYEAVFN